MPENEGWGGGFVEFSKIVNNRISEDGKEVVLMCEGPDAAAFDMVIPTGAIPQLMQGLESSFRAAMLLIKHPIPVSIDGPKFLDAAPVFKVIGISAVVYPDDGSVDIQIQSQNEQEFVVSLPPPIVRVLFQHLLQIQSLDDQRPS